MKPLKLILATLITMVSMTGFAQENAALENIHARKSVRNYTEEPVSPEQVETILKAAMAAPSGRNLQPWRFVVVREQATKDKLAVGFNKMIAKAPVVIVVCGQTTKKDGGRLRDTCKSPGINICRNCVTGVSLHRYNLYAYVQRLTVQDLRRLPSLLSSRRAA